MTVILALEGHDGAGKTTLANRLALALNAPLVAPFGGDYGRQLVLTIGQDEIDTVARAALQDAFEVVRYCPVAVYDRAWLTPLTLIEDASEPSGVRIPTPQFVSDWKPRISTVLLWADLDTTVTRLRERGAVPFNVGSHQLYLGRYMWLAQQHGCEVLRTDRVDLTSSTQQLLSWARLEREHNRKLETAGAPCDRLRAALASAAPPLEGEGA